MTKNGAIRGHQAPSEERLSESIIYTVHHWTVDKLSAASKQTGTYNQRYTKQFEIELDRIKEAINNEGHNWLEINREG